MSLYAKNWPYWLNLEYLGFNAPVSEFQGNRPVYFDTYTPVGYDEEGYLEKIPLGSRGIWIARVQLLI